MSSTITTSVVIVDTESYALARSALDHTLKNFSANDVLIFTDDADKWRPYPIIEIPKITHIRDYNRLMLVELSRRLKTDFALVIQFDGFAVDPSAFTTDFYNYHYIGAPWPAGRVEGRPATVGNGGFSLRSKRLLDRVAAYEAHVDFDIPEDATICFWLREQLEVRDGLPFAPVDLARRFSVEMESADTGSPFGFHGLQWLPIVYADSPAFLIENLPARCFESDSHRLKYLRMGFSKLDDAASARFEQHVAKLAAAGPPSEG